MPDHYPYLARSTIRYKSPHPTDLSFGKDETIRVLGPSEDDEDWLVGESVDGTRAGGFPRDFVIKLEEEPVDSVTTATSGSEHTGITHLPSADQTEPVPEAHEPASTLEPEQPSPPQPTETHEQDLTERTKDLHIAPTTPERPAPPPSASTPIPAAPDSAEKPRSFKDKLAAFNRSAGSTPPPLKPKPAGAAPGTWAWKQKQQQTDPPPPPPVKPSATEPPSEAELLARTPSNRETPEQGGMSASDAKSAIAAGGSLRERMAALAGAGAFGSPGEGDKANVKAKGPPPVVGSKPRVWKRPEVAAAEPEPEAEEAGDPSGSGEGGRSREGEQAEEQHEGDEELREKERRAAIAARMARLGGRGVMGMPMPIGAKPTTVKDVGHETEQAQVEPSAEPGENVEPQTVTSPLGEQAAGPASSGPETTSVPGATIAMPAIPRKAGPPRRRMPTRSDTGGSGVSSPVVGAPDAVPGTTTLAAQSATSAEVPSPTTDGDDRELPLPKTEEQLAQEREFEQAGRGPHGAEGAERAGIALAPVGGGEQASDVAPGGGEHGAVHHERSLPPPPPVAEDDDEEEGEGSDGGDDDGDDDDVVRQAAPGGLAMGPADISTLDPAPVESQPLQAPAPASNVQEPAIAASERTLSPSAPQNLLGLPKDEVEMQHNEQSALEDGPAPTPPPRVGFSSDETERVKPAGPRPLPPSPARGLSSVQAVPPVPSGTHSAGLSEEAEVNRGDVADRVDATPPPPRRQECVRTPAQVGVPLPVKGEETESEANEPRVVITQEPEHVSTPEDAEATRRQGIAARMAKLGGIKLGGPPLTFRRQSTSPGESPISPTFSTKNEFITSPTSPLPSPLEGSPQVAQSADDETDEEAAKRRQATLARLRAGGALGFGMFNNSAPAEEHHGASPVDSAGHPMPPAVPASADLLHAREHDSQDDSTPAPESEIGEREPDVASSPVIVDDDDEAPPPPPRRSLSIKSPVTSPTMPVSARMPSMHASSDVPPPVDDESHEVADNLAPPLPPIVSGHYVHEPETMAETREAADEMGPPPPPPPRTRDTSLNTPSSLDRSESRASRMSTSSLASDRVLPPPSPVTGHRRSNSGVRPGYNELRDATKTYGAKVARAAGKLVESSKKHAVGDGGPRALVWAAMSDAGLDANVTFGTLIWEQQGPAIQQRLDDVHVGDIVVLHDAKFKGKKGLLGYTQQAGSVQEPVFAVCSHVEDKKTKIKVYQYDRGHGDNVTYRLDDLQSGLVRIFRPMP